MLVQFQGLASSVALYTRFESSIHNAVKYCIFVSVWYKYSFGIPAWQVGFVNICYDLGKDREKADESVGDHQSASNSDALLGQISRYIDPREEAMKDAGLDESSNQVGDNQVDDVEDEWNAAINQRYGPCNGNEGTSKSSKSSSNRQSRQSAQADQGGGSASLAPAHPDRAIPADVPVEVESIEMPIRSWIDPNNKRVLAEMPGGRRIALGFLVTFTWALYGRYWRMAFG